jgi:biopolymer transport protein ExbD
MARKVDVEAGETDLTPMIDVCFLLIAFFIMVTEVSKAEIVEIFLPHASYATEDTDPPENRLIVNLTRDGEVWMKGRQFGRPNSTNGRRDITQEFKALAEGVGYESATGPSNLTVLIRADAHVENRFVQCVQMLLVESRVIKVHYSADNPTKS